MSTVLYELRDDVATITLNRPETLNAMNDALMTELGRALEEVRRDEAVRVAVLTGAGRGFCSGADLTAPGEPGERDLGAATARSLDDVFHPAIRALATLPVPTVARVQGVVAGGGLGLALGCDVCIAAQSASFVCTFGPRLGVLPDLGTTWHLPRLVGRSRALGIALLGDRIRAERAAEWGLIWQAVPDSELDGALAEVVERLRRSSPEAAVRIRQALDAAPGHSLDEQLDHERDRQKVLIGRGNMAIGAAAFREKREPVFDGRRVSD